MICYLRQPFLGTGLTLGGAAVILATAPGFWLGYAIMLAAVPA